MYGMGDEMAKVPLWRFMQNILAQHGDKYLFGVQANPDDRNPGEFDCAELVEWGVRFSAHQEGFEVGFPDTSMAQRDHCDRIPIPKAYETLGALLFRDGSIAGTEFNHVVVSMGDSQRTFEAMGSAYGVRFGEIHGRQWTSGGLIPEMDYEATKRAAPRVERAVVFGKNGGRLGFVAVERLETDESQERLLRLLRRADSETGAGILVIRKEPKDLELEDEWATWKASKAR
jgi:hypothetical protein